MADCVKCGGCVYIGSRLSEDAYSANGDIYTHIKCPSYIRSSPHNTSSTAKGDCHWCGNRVPASNLNKFYCSNNCGSLMQEYREEMNPIHDEEEDWYY